MTRTQYIHAVKEGQISDDQEAWRIRICDSLAKEWGKTTVNTVSTDIGIYFHMWLKFEKISDANCIIYAQMQ